LVQENAWVVQRSDGDVSKIKNYVNECESTIRALREQVRELETTSAHKLE
jgi:hypothetical protein